MGRVYIECDGQWVEDKSLRACGPYVFGVWDVFEVLEIARQERTEPVSRGLGMGWPELKDLGVMLDFAEESETITLNKGTNL